MKYKLWLGLTTILWLVYDAYIQSYTAAIFDLSFINVVPFVNAASKLKIDFNFVTIES